MPSRLPALKNARQQWSGVFFALLICVATVNADCGPMQSLQWNQLESVVDGDTLRLKDGRKLRLIAVNTPELARDGVAAQPLAEKARQAVQQFFAGEAAVGWHHGEQRKDRYGRELAYIFRRDGRSLAAFLVEQGFGWRIAIAPNLDYQPCLQALEAVARQQQRGVWREPLYALRDTAALTVAHTGFRLVTGVVDKVTATRSGWWVDLPGLSLRISRRGAGGDIQPEQWLQRRLVVRGWVIDRSDSKAARQGYAPLMMSVNHLSMVEVLPAADDLRR